jgi:hypothetical protein
MDEPGFRSLERDAERSAFPNTVNNRAMTVTLFSWGYWGWGQATTQLVQAVDIAEEERGLRPPIFVDIRLRREGRAKGFIGNTFRDLVGESRYRWMEGLGNAYIASGEAGIKIKRPDAAADLLALALRAAEDKRRVIFYCACEFPWCQGKRSCHRDKVTELLLSEAQQAGRTVSIIEWPGGQPVDNRLRVDHKLFMAVMNGRMSIPFDGKYLAEYAGLPWGSILTLEDDHDTEAELVAVGPAMFATSKITGGHWFLPVFLQGERGKQRASLVREVNQWRRQCGLHERCLVS